MPPGTPGRSPLGIKLVDALLTFANTYTNATTPNAYIWSSIWTPYNPGVGTPNVAGTVTAVSLTPLPIALTLKGAFTKKTKTARSPSPWYARDHRPAVYPTPATMDSTANTMRTRVTSASR